MFFSHIYKHWKKIQFEKYEQVLDLLKLLENPVLDLGCGNDYLREFMENNGILKEVMGIDMIHCFKYGNSVIGDVNKLPFKKESFSSLVCFDTIHFVCNIGEINDLLKKGGMVVCGMFCNKNNIMEVERGLENVFAGFKLLKRRVLGGKEMELVWVLRKSGRLKNLNDSA